MQLKSPAEMHRQIIHEEVTLRRGGKNALREAQGEGESGVGVGEMKGEEGGVRQHGGWDGWGIGSGGGGGVASLRGAVTRKKGRCLKPRGCAVDGEMLG